MCIRHVLVTGLMLTCLGGCATLFGDGGAKEMTFRSSQSGVKMYMDGNYLGELPQAMMVEAQMRAPKVSFRKEGYQSQSFQLKRELNTLVISDISSPLTSGGIDVMTGEFMQYSDTDYRIELVAVGLSSRPDNEIRKLKLDHFVHTHFDAIQKELATKEGEHLLALTTLIGADNPEIAQSQRAELIAHRKELLGLDVALFMDEVHNILSPS